MQTQASVKTALDAYNAKLTVSPDRMAHQSEADSFQVAYDTAVKQGASADWDGLHKKITDATAKIGGGAQSAQKPASQPMFQTEAAKPKV